MSCTFTAEQVAQIVGGQLHGSAATVLRGVSTDSRENLTGRLFIALKGDKFDGHDFIQKAFKEGATAALVSGDYEIPEELKGQAIFIQANDTLKAMQTLATIWRKYLSAKVVAITGSNGKSTTKDFVAQILSGFKKVHVAQKSYNNHIGVPLTILDAPADTEVLVLEMGMNHSGELTELSKIATPDIVMCTTVGRAHIGHFKSGIDGIAAAKEEIYLANPKATMIFNHDNEHTISMFDKAKKTIDADRLKVFSTFTAGAEVSMRAMELHLEKTDISGHIAGIEGKAVVPIFGRHNVINLMAASSVALVVGMLPEDIWKNLSKCKTSWGRGQLYNLPNGARVIFDGYNANPDSVALLVKNLYEIYLPNEGKKHAVMAEMLELGDRNKVYHEELGQMIGQTDFESIFFFGPSNDAFKKGVESSGFDKNIMISDTYEESLALKLQSMLNPGDVVIMKGSRGSQVERVLKLWDPGFK